MADLIKREIVERLAKYTKGLKPKDISLQFLTGKGELKNLELNPAFLMQVLMFPPWLEIASAKVDLIRCKVPFTKIRSEPITVQLNNVTFEIATCDPNKERDKQEGIDLNKLQGSSGKYGLMDKIIDGMTLEIRSINGSFKDPTFEGSFEMTDLKIFSVPAPGMKAKNLKEMFVRCKEEDTMIIYKKIKIHSLKIQAHGMQNGEPLSRDAMELRLLINETSLELAFKRLIKDCSILFVRIFAYLGDLVWILTQSQLRSLSYFVQNLIEIAIKTHHHQAEARLKELLQAKQQAAPKQESKKGKGPVSQGKFGSFGGLLDGGNLPKVTEWLQKIYQDGNRELPKWEIIQHSLHVVTRDVHIQLCNDMLADNTISPSITGSSVLKLQGLEIDIYPDQKAGTGRNHWRNSNDHIKNHHDMTRKDLQEAAKMKVASSSTTSSTPSSFTAESDGFAPSDASTPSSGHSRSQFYGSNQSSGASTPKRMSATATSKEPPMKASYQSRDLEDDDDAVVISSPLENIPEDVLSGMGSRSSSLMSLQSTDSTSPISKVRLSRLHERSIVLRCCKFTIESMSDSEGKVSPLPFVRSDKELFHIPDFFPALQVSATLFFYPGHTAGKDFLVPRPVVSVDMCPLHLVLNQQTTVWFVDFVQGILGTIDFGLVSKVTKDIQKAVKKLKEKREAKYPFPTSLKGFNFTFKISYTKITIPVYEKPGSRPSDNRPTALQAETSEIRISALTKSSLKLSQDFGELMERIKEGWLYSESNGHVFPHEFQKDLPFLPQDCLPFFLEDFGFVSTPSPAKEPSDEASYYVNECMAVGSPWYLSCDCVCLRFVHELGESGVTEDTTPFVNDFPLTAWIFPSLDEVAESIASSSDLVGDSSPFPAVAVFAHIKKPLFVELIRQELLTILRLKDSLNNFKHDLIQRLLPMRNKVKQDIAKGPKESTSHDGDIGRALRSMYSSGALFLSGAELRMILPSSVPPHPGETDHDQSTLEVDDPQAQCDHSAETRETITEDYQADHKGIINETRDSIDATSSGHFPSSEGITVPASTPLPAPPQLTTLALGNNPIQSAFRAGVSDMEVIFTVCQEGVTAKMGIHKVAMQEEEFKGKRGIAPDAISTPSTVDISKEPVICVRFEVGDQVARFYSEDLPTIPDALARIHVNSLNLDMISRNAAAISAFSQDEIPPDKPMPIEVLVRDTGVLMRDSALASADDLSSVAISVNRVAINRGPRPFPLHSVEGLDNHSELGSADTLAGEGLDPNTTEEDLPKNLASPSVKINISMQEHTSLSVDGQKDSSIPAINAFVAQLKGHMGRIETSKLQQTPELLALMESMQMALGAPSMSISQGESPPSYTTVTSSNQQILHKLQILEKERDEMREQLHQLTNDYRSQSNELKELEQMLAHCKLELAEQKAIVFDKDDKIKNLLIEQKQKHQ